VHGTWCGTGGHWESLSITVTNSIMVNVEYWQPFVIHCEHTGCKYYIMISSCDSIKLILNKANHLENVSVVGLDFYHLLLPSSVSLVTIRSVLVLTVSSLFTFLTCIDQ
jgi:hypothetical protein